MDFGFGLPMRGPLAKPETLVALSRRGEELGFRYIGASDHIVIPRYVRSRYPYTENGEFRGGQSGEYLEQLSVLSFVASQTSAARLLTSVMVLPHRSPVQVAKTLATLDVLSGGRLTLGFGTGWMREEFEAIGAPPYDERGRVSDEYIKVFKELWTSEDPTFAGRYSRFSGISFLPKPVQKPHPPIWIGGESPPALRRTAALGNGWYPIGSNPRFPLRTPEEYSEARDRLYRYAEEQGRDPSEIDLALSAGWYDENNAQALPGGHRLPLTGSAEQIAGDIKALAELGVRHLILNFQASTLQETQQRMEYFATEVAPLVS